MIGLFFGETIFPKLILKSIKKKQLKYSIIDLSKNSIYKKDKYSYSLSIGQFGKILKLLRQKKCKKVIFAGKIDKPKFSELKLDATGIYYIPRIIRAVYFNPELSLPRGNYSKIKPTKQDLIDIKYGIKALKKSNAHDHVQAVVSRNGNILKETNKGTKKMLQSIKKNNSKSGVLIKFPKKKQDLRADLPTIGIETFKDCKRAGLKGVVLKRNQNIFLEKRKCINYANKNKMFIISR